MADQADLRPRNAGALLLVGGGRWARVYLSVLSGMECPFAKVIVASRHGGDRLAEALARASSSHPFVLAQNADGVPEKEPIGAAIVANAARDHVATALSLLSRKIPLLVEKPVALTQDDAARLIGAAQTARTLLMPGHVFRHCEYLRNFAAAAQQTFGALQSATLFWRDARNEIRHGESKGYDTGLGLVEDMGPHAATILSVALGGKCDEIEHVAIARGGLAVTVNGAWNGTGFALRLERDAAQRERVFILKSRDGREARLDFSVEPGNISIDGITRSADPHWSERPSPLARQLIEFFAKAATGPDGRALKEIQDSADFIARMAGPVRAAQEALLTAPSRAGADPGERLVAMREIIAPQLIEMGCWGAGDMHQLDLIARQALAMLADGAIGVPLADMVRGLVSGRRP